MSGPQTKILKNGFKMDENHVELCTDSKQLPWFLEHCSMSRWVNDLPPKAYRAQQTFFRKDHDT